MKYRYYFTVLVLLLCSPVIAAAEQYLCVAEHATGFSYNKVSKSWENATFKADNKYIISKAEPQSPSYKVTQIGSTESLAWCKDGFNEGGYLLCEGVGEFRFNKNNGKFIRIHEFGYIEELPGVPEFTNKFTPFMEIGMCSPF